MTTYRIIEQRTRFAGARYDVQVVTDGRHVAWHEFATRELAQAWVDAQGPAEYFRGDRIRDTGRTVDMYGATWRVCEYVEGHRQGQECLRPVGSC